MNTGRILTPFFDLREHSRGKSGFFFLEHILRARIDLHLETAEESCGEELNIYVAGLLNSLLFGGEQLRQKPYISPFDTDIQRYISEHPGLRCTYTVYRENADVSLLFSGLFSGYRHEGSYHHRVIASDGEDTGRIALYYEIAASALAHLQGNNASLVEVLETLSERIDMIIKIVRYAAGTYFDMMERFSEGSMYHLGKEIDMLDARKVYEQKLDEFLKAYSCHIENPTEQGKASLLARAEEIRKLKSDFTFEL